MSSLKGTDGCTDIVLDFVAGGVPGNPVGESKGNYNAVIGSVFARDDLGLRTINGIYELQSALVARGLPSGAVGRYQIIQRTLRGLAAKLGLSGNEMFTPDLQDRLAVELLKGRGYSDWWRGEMADEDFAHGLSCEWASLPDPQNGGRSHYDGVAGNHASTNLAAVYAMLKQAREAMVTSSAAAGHNSGEPSRQIKELPPEPGHDSSPECHSSDIDRDLLADLLRAIEASTCAAQRVLREAGFYDGQIDGIRGPKMAAAIIEAQRKAA